MDKQINKLQPGQQTKPIITEFASTWAERSGDGKWLRFVRQIGNVTTVFKTERF